ncbi:Protein of unknown function [Tenacibaculum sp. MAR_2009_124]|uniref:DUF2752 domain-containing protein n=1 Tax=Tenacibaculum sp. MAR_2009_124 TaxID=1250059 RepID=UPI00089B59B1|nr:DUF2752 domain-containing protein [Tenacibaculum sp. MAR_2009_124]SEB38038.1 Protein of unknown function [Tenacibaculum sp. MAR_2009_124]
MKLEDYMLPCMNKEIFGIDCPGCGLQRSAALLSEGKFYDAFTMFPAIYTTILLVVIAIFHFFLKKKITLKILVILAISNVVIIILAYIIKMNKLFS